MKSKSTNFIMCIVILLIIAVIGIFGEIILEELKSLDIAQEPEDYETLISSTPKQEIDNMQTPNIVENNSEQLPNITSNNGKVNYNNISIDKYFYNQLEEEAKTIYKALEANRENMKTGTYKIEFGNSFSALLNTENGQEELGKHYQAAIDAYICDNTDIFYLSTNKMCLNIETTTTIFKTTYNVYIDSGKAQNYLVDEFPTKEAVEEAISKVESAKNAISSRKTGNTYNDIKMVHDYLVDNIEYDTSISKENIYNVCGALINRICVCEGYARAFKYIMDDMQIPCVLVKGKATNSKGETENHAWNYVYLDDSWYAVDITWDDPVVLNGGKASYSAKYRYFLKGTSTMNADHTPSGQFSENGKVFNYPTLSNSDY